MTIDEVKVKLQDNYNTHYENVKVKCMLNRENAIKYIQEQTDCEYFIAQQIVNEWIDSIPVQTNDNTRQYKEININQIEYEKLNILKDIRKMIKFFYALSIIGIAIYVITLLIGIIS